MEIKKGLPMASLTIQTAGEQYKITLSQPVAVEGDDVKFANSLALLAAGAMEDYSPAFGDPAAFVAEQLSQRLGAAVVSINSPPPKSGVIY